MIVFDCAVCRKKLSALPTQVGNLVLCPNCRTKLKVPAQPLPQEPELVGAGVEASSNEIAFAPDPTPAPRPPPPPRPSSAYIIRPTTSSGKRYGFNCGYCSSRLEATESMAAQDGQCPTCGNAITIPIQDRYGRLIDPKTRQIIRQDPHPVHAYAAAGDRAPAILRQRDGKQIIRCARCKSVSAITANNCKACGMPFTMEGTTIEAAGTSNGFAVAGLVLGIIGLPAFCLVLPSVLAIVFGGVGLYQIKQAGGEGSGKGMAITGIAFGIIGTLAGVYRMLI